MVGGDMGRTLAQAAERRSRTPIRGRVRADNRLTVTARGGEPVLAVNVGDVAAAESHEAQDRALLEYLTPSKLGGTVIKRG